MYNDIEINSNGVISYEPVTDEWVLKHKPPTILLSLSKPQIIDDGLDISVLTVTLQTPMLINGSYEPVLSNEAIEIITDGDIDNPDIVNLVDGIGTIDYTSDMTGVYGITAKPYAGNTVELEVINA